MKIIKITWEDAGTGLNVWCMKNDYVSELGIVESVGYLVEKTRKVIIIAQSTSDTQYGNILVIPRGSVKKLEEIK